MSDEMQPEPATGDPVLGMLMTARPEAAADDATEAPDAPAAQALLSAILAFPEAPAAHRRARSRRVRLTASALSAAAAITMAVMIVNSVGVDHGRVIVQQQSAAAVDMVAIARASAGAFASSGRAAETFDVGPGSITEQRGTSQIAFSGSDLDVMLHFDGVAGRPGFDAHNTTVDGRFYLEDGPPGAKKWYHDINATPEGSEIFNLDPRALLSVLRPAAGFVVVDATTAADGVVRHLRATRLGALPSLRVSLGKVDGRDITSLDLWVGADDTVRRLALTVRHTEVPAPAFFVQGGVKHVVKPGDKLAKVGDRITIVPGRGSAAPAEPVTTTGSYTVRFTDIGTRISITAPANATTVQGVG
jgi:hypothetical protein